MRKQVSLFLGHVTLWAFLQSCLPLTALAGPPPSSPPQAAGSRQGSYSLTDDLTGEAHASEFVMRRYPGEHLLPIRILSGVKNPGTYYLPEGTDLITAIALSGGLTNTADPEKLHWNQWNSQKITMIDLNETVAEPQKANPRLGANDVVMIEEEKPWVSNNTILLVTLLTGVLSVVLSAKALTK